MQSMVHIAELRDFTISCELRVSGGDMFARSYVVCRRTRVAVRALARGRPRM
jgi:hypothetical protein